MITSALKEKLENHNGEVILNFNSDKLKFITTLYPCDVQVSEERLIIKDSIELRATLNEECFFGLEDEDEVYSFKINSGVLQLTFVEMI